MKALKVLLIAPSYVDTPNSMYFPIGLSYLASYVASKGYAVDGLNMNNYGLRNGLEKLREKLGMDNYDVIGIGALTVAFERIKCLVKYLRALTNATIVIGGGVTSCESELVIQQIRPDYMVIGEGELIFEELLAHIENPTIFSLPKGTWSSKNNIIVSNNENHAIHNLDTLPFPDYKLMGVEKFMDLQPDEGWSHHKTDTSVGKFIPISASRSCPFRCTFCHHAGMGVYRKHSVEYAVAFIKRLLKEYHVKHFSIYDELFSMNKKRVIEFCKVLKPLSVTFMCQLRVDQVDNEMLGFMKDAGCTEISYGIESGSEVVIKSMNKKIHVQQIENAIRLTREAKIGIQGNLLFGDPAETKDTIEESLKFQRRNRLYFVDWSMVIPYPGTALHGLALSKNMIKDRVEFIKDVANTSKYLWNCPINLTGFSDEEYLDRYVQLRELNDENHRKVCSKIKKAYTINEFSSYMKLQCPHCENIHEYKQIPFPLNKKTKVTEDRASFYGFLGINLVCPNCRNKHYLVPKGIPHVGEIFAKYDESLDAFVKKDTKNIVLLPAIDRYFHAIQEDTKALTIKPYAVLDTREYRINQKFLGVTVEELNRENIVKLSDKRFVILPWVESEKVYLTLLENGVFGGNILSWNKTDSW